MARTVRDTALDSRAARVRLKSRHEPYWRTIEQGSHLGYRKGARGGVWLARSFQEGAYKKAGLGITDDVRDANGVDVLSFKQAQEKARAWFDQKARQAAGLEPAVSGPYTVRTALRDYLTEYARRGKARANTEWAVKAHIEPSLGDMELGRLTTKTIRRWLEDLADKPPRIRTSRGGAQQQHRKPSNDADAQRRRRATANRVLHILKAALNHAWREGKAATDEPWRRVRPFHNVDAPVIRYLTEAESVRLVNASRGLFRLIVKGALLTGCRYGELTALRASDFSEESGTLNIRTSKSGKSRHVTLTKEGQAFFSAVTEGKPRETIIFPRDDGTVWGRNHQQRPLAEACKKAKVVPSIGFHVLRHTHGSVLAMNGAPLPVIAKQLGHADTRMTEKHYAHLAPNYVSETIRASLPEFGFIEKSNVRRLKSRPRN